MCKQKSQIKLKVENKVETPLTFATQSFRFGGGSFGFPRPKRRFILKNCHLNFSKQKNSYNSAYEYCLPIGHMTVIQ